MKNAEIQSLLIHHRLLDPPADGQWGGQSRAALAMFQQLAGLGQTGNPDDGTLALLKAIPEILPIKLGNDLASRIIKYCLEAGFWVPVGPAAYTICYVEGMDENGQVNSDEPDEWNDRRIVIEIPDGTPKIVGNWRATSEPGSYYTHNRMNAAGVARIKFGQYKAWVMGWHGSHPYEALEQLAPITVYRDDNEDYCRTGDSEEEGLFGVNQHHGYDCPTVDNNSAGCLVGQSIAGHEDFIDLLKGDRRYKANANYLFYTAVIAGDRLTS
jgi:hypothetical protein